MTRAFARTVTIFNDWPIVAGRDTPYRQYIEKEPIPVAEGTGIIGRVGMLEYTQVLLLLGLGAVVGYLLAWRLAHRDYDRINKRLDELRIEIRQLPTIEIRSPVDLTPITTIVETLERRVAVLSERLTATPRADIRQNEPRVLGTKLVTDKDDPPT